MSIRTTAEDYLFRVYRIIGRTLIAYSQHPRRGSAPYITGDGFRELADHIFDTTARTLDPAAIEPYDIVFVGDSLIAEYLATIHPHITGPYTLITHNGDAVVDERLFTLASDKVTTWYGINVLYTHPHLIPIPLGIENQHYFICGIPAVFNWVRKRLPNKRNNIFYGFTISTNVTERQAAFDVIHTHPDAVTLKTWRNFFTYLVELAHYKFVLSPPGSSVEGHRTWDTLYTSGVPIVKSSVTTNYFKSIGVPLLVINDWDELRTLTSETIAPLYDAIQNDSDTNTLSMHYWKTQIESTRIPHLTS